MDAALDLIEALRAAATPRAWSRGTALAERGAVELTSACDDEVRARVVPRPGLLPVAVRLFPPDAEWDCSCDEEGGEACEHVVAAAVAWERGDPVTERVPVTVGYRFRRAPAGLHCARVLVSGPEEEPLAWSASLAAPRDGTRADVTARDLDIERALGSWTGPAVTAELLPRLLAALAGAPDVTLDGAPVRLSAGPVEPFVVRVEDRGDGFRLVLARNPAVGETIGPAALVAGALRPLAAPRLSEREKQLLPRGVAIPSAQVGVLVGQILPDLRARIPVDVVTARLPGSARLPARVLVEVGLDAGAAEPTLLAQAVVVYGRPAAARVEDGRVVHLAGPVPVRDEAAERAAAAAAERALGLRAGACERFEGDAGVAFAARLRAWDGEVVGTAHAGFFLAPPVVPVIAPGAEDDAAVAFVSAPGAAGRDGRDGTPRSAPAARVLAAWARGATLVPLDGGGFAPLPRAWLDRHGSLVADLLAAREVAGGRLPRAALPQLGALCDALGAPPPTALAELRRALDEPAPPPPELHATLRDYQRAGIDWLSRLRRAGLGGILADDMGLGKTLQAIAVLGGRALVVCPASVLVNWAREIERFRPGLPHAVYHGPERRLPGGDAVVLTTYALLRLDQDALTERPWDAVVLDEAQAIKNPDSQVARAASRIDARFRLALTGTPVENRALELWSLLRFAAPGLLGTRADFERRYARPLASGDAAAGERLAARIRPFVLRRLKREVAPELPPRTEVTLRVELPADERAVYDAVRAAARADLARAVAPGGNPLGALEALLRLRQAACHPSLVPGHAKATSAKLDALGERLETALAEGHKALVFSQWTSLLDLVEPQLAALGAPYTRLDGATADRQAVVDAFQADDGPPVMLVSLKAGGVGLNLAAADHVFLLDPWWNPAVEDQAIDRAHRIGQQRPVVVHRLVAEGTVDERLLALQESKRGLSDALLAGTGGGLTREDLQLLLS